MAVELVNIGFCIVPIARLELRQQVEQLTASNEALKSSNETLTDDVARLNETAQHVSDVWSKYLGLFLYFSASFSILFCPELVFDFIFYKQLACSIYIAVYLSSARFM